MRKKVRGDWSSYEIPTADVYTSTHMQIHVSIHIHINHTTKKREKD